MSTVALTQLDGAVIQVNPAEVTSLRPVPANLLPAGVANGTYCDHESGARYAINGTVPATEALLNAGGGFYATLADLAGNTVRANANLVSGLLAIAASQLPVGVAAGTDVQFDQATSLKVNGTVAATSTTLAAADNSAGLLAWALVSGAGALVASRGVAGAVRNGAGDYTVTFSQNLTGLGAAAISNNNGTDNMVSTDGPLGLTQDVLTFSDAGAAEDCGFFLFVLPI